MPVALFGMATSRRSGSVAPPPSGLSHVALASADFSGHPTIPDGDLQADVTRYDTDLRTALGLPAGTHVLAGPHGYHTGWVNTFASCAISWAPAAGFTHGLINMKIGSETTWAGAAAGSWDSALTTFVNSVPDGFTCIIVIQHEPENDGVQPNADGGTWEDQYGPDWSRMQARFAGIVATINRPNVFYAVVYMAVTFPGWWVNPPTIAGQPGQLGFNQRDPENWNAWQFMTAAAKARTVFAPDIYTRIDNVSATPTSWGADTAVVSDAESGNVPNGRPVMVFASNGTTPTQFGPYRIISKTGSSPNPRTITVSPAWSSVPSAGSTLRVIDLFASDYQDVLDYVTNAGWGVQLAGIGEHTINNDAFTDPAAVAFLIENDLRPYLRGLAAAGKLGFYAHFDHSSGLASGVNGWWDTTPELLAAGGMFRELNAGTGGGGGGSTSLAFRAAASAGANTQFPAVSVPAAAVAGDYALLSFSCSTTPTVTDPAGWTVVQSAVVGSMQSKLYGRTLVAGDLGAAVGPGLSAISRWQCNLAVYSGAHGTTPVHTSAVATSTVANTVQSTAPVTTAVDGCMIVSVACNRGSTTANTTLWGPPGGYSLRQAFYPSGFPGTSSAVADKGTQPAGTYGPDTWTSDASLANFAGFTVALRPA
jgi:hypothetical protein